MFQCKEAMFARVLAVMFCLLQLCNSQQVNVQVTRGGDTINLHQRTEYYIFEEGAITFRCFCSNQGVPPTSRVTSIRWLHRGEIVESSGSCIALTYTLTEANSDDNGERVCEVSYANGNTTQFSAGTLEVIDPNIVSAPENQFGLVGTNASLTCTTTEESSSISITWFHENGASAENVFESVEIGHEGTYVCSVFLGTFDLRAVKTISFAVIVPPAILSEPPQYNHLVGNQPAQFPVSFESRFQNDTVIVWYKNRNSAVEKEFIRTLYHADPNAMTELNFANLRRRDAGLYTVAIQNTFPGLAAELRQVETSFTVAVTVLPAIPSNLHFPDISSTKAKLTWDLANQNEDDLPDNITIKVYYSNGTLALEYVVNGAETELNLDLVPGTDYTLRMISANIDGERMTEEVVFKSVNGRPSTPHLTVERTAPTVFSLTASLAYTGGGDITQFMVRFRTGQNPAAGWRDLGAVQALATGNLLEWRVVAVHPNLTEQCVEFSVAAVNTHGYVSQPALQQEAYDLPGAPQQPNHVSSTPGSLLVQVQLSSAGSGPIIALYVQFADNFTRQLESRHYVPGELVQDRIEGLEPDTTYEFTIVAENYCGMGQPSPPILAATDPVPPVPLYGIALIATVIAIAIILCVIILILVGLHAFNVQKEKRQYHIHSGSKSEKGGKSVTASETKLVSGTKRPPLPHLPPTSPLSDPNRPSSQSTVSRQGSTSTYPLSPQRTISTSDGGSPMGQFEFNQGPGSVATSNETESEMDYPRYLYRVSPVPPCINSSSQYIAPVSSLHSMQSYHHSTTTQLTASSDSTRESILLSPEFQATNV